MTTIAKVLGRGPVHPFPARMAAGIALAAMSKAKRPLRVLDPMAGSGTVVAVAQARGHRAVGVDVDPLSVLLARVWTRPIGRMRVHRASARVLERARRLFSRMPASAAYPVQADAETRAFIRYWFDPYVRKQLAALAFTISGVRPLAVREVLWCAFSRLIIAKQAGASLALDLSHSRPHKSFDYAPVKPFNRWDACVREIVGNCLQLGQRGVGPRAEVRLGDARRLPIRSRSVDLVVTSPPYLNALDYLRCSKFSLVWMGHSIERLRAIRTRSVGTEKSTDRAKVDENVAQLVEGLRLRPALPGFMHARLRQYALDMLAAVSETARVLRVGGRAVYVVGDSNVRGTFVENSALVAAIAKQCGLTVMRRRSRMLLASRRYLPPPVGRRGSMSVRMRREVVLVFHRRAA